LTSLLSFNELSFAVIKIEAGKGEAPKESYS
jgi:hypothetical protein